MFNILKNNKLKIEAETVFSSVIGASLDNQQKVAVKRVFAKGGFVMTEYVDIPTGDLKMRMLPPSEAARRSAALTELGRRSGGKAVQHDLITAINKAAIAAKAQADEGENPLLNMNKAARADIDLTAMEVMDEILAARRADPALDEEMRKAELAV